MTVRGELLRRGMTRHDLAARVGISADTLTNVMSGNNRSPVTRWKIEVALQMAIWTDPAEFSARRTMRGVFGVDLYALNRRQLDPYARKFLPPGDLRAQYLARRELLLRLSRVALESPPADPP